MNAAKSIPERTVNKGLVVSKAAVLLEIQVPFSRLLFFYQASNVDQSLCMKRTESSLRHTLEQR